MLDLYVYSRFKKALKTACRIISDAKLAIIFKLSIGVETALKNYNWQNDTESMPVCCNNIEKLLKVYKKVNKIKALAK